MQLGQHISQISPEVDPELLIGDGEARNENAPFKNPSLRHKEQTD